MNKSLILKRTALAFFGLVLLAGISLSGFAALTFYRSGPEVDGEVKLSGLSAPVEIVRDGYGVPHIFAPSLNDAARALGYVHASERFFQMEMQRRAGQGRLSEILGKDMLGVDKFVRTLGLYNLATSSFDSMSPEAQVYFRAYAGGVNSWLEKHRHSLPPEFLILGDEPEAWSPPDSVVWGKLMALELSHNYHLEILRAQLATKLPADRINWLFPMPASTTPVTTQPRVISQSFIEVPLQKTKSSPDQELAAFLGIDHAASNEWVIGGERTQSGKPILANDPHLGLEAPILWYLARIVTPQGSIKGATVPGLPIFLLGQNDHIAWGFTTTGSDVEDLFVETIDPQNPDAYMTPDGSKPLLEHSETIRIKNAPNVTLNVRATRHGPVLSDVSPEVASIAPPGKVVALSFTGLGDHDRTSEALLHVNQAKNAMGLLEALKDYEAPPQNMVYADDAGSFGYINPGLVPRRKKGEGLIPSDGSSGDNDWVNTVPFDHLPQIANPKSGYVFNANNAVVGPESGDYFGQDWEEPYRALRIQNFFDRTERFDLKSASEMQGDKLSLVAKDFLPILLSIAPRSERARQALQSLQKWDGVMAADRPEPALFEAWLYQFHNQMFAKTGVDMKEKGPFSAMTLMDLITHHALDWCGDAKCQGLIEQSFEDALLMMAQRQGPDMAAWRWGRENIASLTHKFYSHIPLLKNWSDLSIGSGGDFYTLDRGGGFENDPEHPFARTHGGGYRGVYDLANPDASLFMIATGESGHIFNQHYGDLVPLWRDTAYITLSGDADALRREGGQTLVLAP